MKTRVKNWILRPYLVSERWIEEESTILVTDTFCVTSVINVIRPSNTFVFIISTTLDPPSGISYTQCKKFRRNNFSTHRLVSGGSRVIALHALLNALHPSATYYQTRKYAPRTTLQTQCKNHVIFPHCFQQSTYPNGISSLNKLCSQKSSNHAYWEFYIMMPINDSYSYIHLWYKRFPVVLQTLWCFWNTYSDTSWGVLFLFWHFWGCSR